MLRVLSTHLFLNQRLHPGLLENAAQAAPRRWRSSPPGSTSTTPAANTSRSWRHGSALGVRLEDGRQVELDLARYGAVDYGYALTTYKSQGQTYDKVVVEADTSAPQLQDQRNTYVQITRAREDVRIVTDDFFELRDVAGVLSVKADTNDLEISLADARRMEQRAREAALTVRARQEASAKAVQAPEAHAVIGYSAGGRRSRPQSRKRNRSGVPRPQPGPARLCPRFSPDPDGPPRAMQAA